MFNGVKRSYTLLILFLIEVIEELGTDRSLEMLQKAIEKQAEVIYRNLLRDLPKNLTPLEIGETVYRIFMDEAGAKIFDHERTDSSITYRVSQCPFFDAFIDVGIDCGYFLGGLCSNFTLPAIQSILRRFDERLTVESRLIRDTAEEFCLEKIILRT
jgi:hypothetical protein